MKLIFHGHNERYTVEQSLLNLFPRERPVYPEDININQNQDELDNRAIVTLDECSDSCTATAELFYDNKHAKQNYTQTLPEDLYVREGLRRHAIGAAFFLAAREALDKTPPWGMLTGVRPDKPAVKVLSEGKSPAETRKFLEEYYYVSPGRAALATETALQAVMLSQDLRPKDIAVYIGIPFCPTRCAYCSFVSQSVEKSAGLIEPYIETLLDEIQAGGELIRRLGLRVRALYMGGGTPTSLSAQQLSRILSLCSKVLGIRPEYCPEITVEAGRPDTITPEKLQVLKTQGVTRLSVNPQSMEPHVLQAIGRRHLPEDIHQAMELVHAYDFSCVNMDLIAGLPQDSTEGFARSLQSILEFQPEDITIHTLALKKGSRITLENPDLPSPEEVAEMLACAEPVLRRQGYAPYYLYRQKYMSGGFENIGWKRHNGGCRYNIYIMSELCSILSFGAGGSTKMLQRNSHDIQRVFNQKYPLEYIQRPEKYQKNLQAFADFYETRF